MRQTISGLVAAFALVAASAVPAMACGGLFQGGCSPCGQAYVSPCAQPQVYVAPVQPIYYGCNSCGWAYERLPDPVEQYHVTTAPQQYYYADQGPTYTGPGNFAPYPVYRESGVSQPPYYGYRAHHYHAHTGYRYGYGHHYHAMHREHVLRRYY